MAILRLITLVGIVLCAVHGVAVWGVSLSGLPVFSGVGYFVASAFLLGLPPLVIARCLLLWTAARTWPWPRQVVSIVSCWFAGFLVVFAIAPLLGAPDLRTVLRDATIATVLMLLLHATVWGLVRGVIADAGEVPPN